ncbi:hypothetical protein B7P43_G11845 [Cryptotermes secundus]|uniref:Uncharacterized protein n=1 Tax=Cryptotermes secundus TaxID=105785 RepID=A0A2J7RQ16_9NEOP|nr:hypothetical protein B7P43_G11845 [Cryptotermes secundus]
MYSSACQTHIATCSAVLQAESEEFKEFIDAESLMPLPTSDFRNPVCLEMKTLKAGYWAQAGSAGGQYVPMSIDLNSASKVGANSNNGDLGSVDSSDTYASCSTHPFLSQGDLTSDIADPACAIVDLVLDSNLYVNPMDNQRSRDSSPLQQLQQPLVLSALSTSRGSLGVVKKSASGDTALRSLGASPMDESFQGFPGVASERGSRGSLNDTPLPKHRKTRFQQGVKLRTRFGEPERATGDSQESLETKQRGSSKRPSFMPTRSIASATRLINQHLFGIQTLEGKEGRSKSSLSVDSIDSRTSPTLDQHRRSKSILKKSDSSGHHHRNGRSSTDPETEKLISDNTSGVSASDNGGTGCGAGSGSEYSPNKLPIRAATLSPPATPAMARQPQKLQQLRAIGPKSGTKPHALPIKFVGLSEEGDKSRKLKSPLLMLEDLFGGEKHARDEASVENRYRERLEAVVGGCVSAPGDGGCCGGGPQTSGPLYICPPASAAEEHSPTEETKLLLHQTAVELLAPARRHHSGGAGTGSSRPRTKQKQDLPTS